VFFDLVSKDTVSLNCLDPVKLTFHHHHSLKEEVRGHMTDNNPEVWAGLCWANHQPAFITTLMTQVMIHLNEIRFLTL